MFDLSVAWAVIIAVGVFVYVVLDGFDLGIGLLFPFFPNDNERRLMMHSVAPVWDGNETWLVLGGAGLFAAFPMVYSVVLSALYLPLVLMLVGLVFRGVAFEIRAKANRTRHVWDLAFIGGSAMASFFQGVSLGAYIQGITVSGREFAGGGFDWLSPFSLFTGLGVLATYAVLGCGWLIIKTEGPLQHKLFRVLRGLLPLWLLMMLVVSVWTPLVSPLVAAKWLDGQHALWLAPLPLGVLLCAVGMQRAIARRHDYLPYLLALLMAGLGYAGFVLSIWPHLIPPGISLWQAAAPASSQRFALAGAVIIIPIILFYTALGYWVFRGKVRAEEGYH